MSLYLTLKFIHVASVIFWIGGILAMNVFTIRTARAGQAATMAQMMEQVVFYGGRVVGPASGLTLLAGIAMVLAAKMRFETPWVIWGFAGILFHFFVGFVIVPRNGKRLGALLARGGEIDKAALADIANRQRTIAVSYLLVMLSVVWAMVNKPAF